MKPLIHSDAVKLLIDSAILPVGQKLGHTPHLFIAAVPHHGITASYSNLGPRDEIKLLRDLANKMNERASMLERAPATTPPLILPPGAARNGN